MFLLFHVLECFHSLEKYSFSKRSFIFLCLLSLVKSGYGGASQVNLWVEEIFISYSQRPLFLTADCSSEVQGLLKRWSILFCFVFFSPHCPNNSSSYTFFSCCIIFQQNSSLALTAAFSPLYLAQKRCPDLLAKTSIEDRAIPQAKQNFGLWFRNSGVSSLCSRWMCDSSGPPDSYTPFPFCCMQGGGFAACVGTQI